MTEREYVLTLKAAAEDYISQVRVVDDGYKKAADRWHLLRDKLSPFTFLDLCNAWLETNNEKAKGNID